MFYLLAETRATLLSLRELLRLSLFVRSLLLAWAFGLVGELGQTVRTGLNAEKEQLILSLEVRLSTPSN